MPKVTRWFVKTAILWFALALLLEIYQQIPGVWPPGLFPVGLHLLVFGWLTQLVFGIAIWMLPKLNNEHPRGIDWLNWGMYACLNAGLLLRLVFEPLHTAQMVAWSGEALVVSAGLQWLAGMLFVGQAWGRVKGR